MLDEQNVELSGQIKIVVFSVEQCDQQSWEQQERSTSLNAF